MRRLLWLAVLLGASALAVVPAALADDDPVSLTDDEQAKVVALVREDPRIRATVGDAAVHVEDVLPWSADGTRRTLMGGGAMLVFDRPHDVEADWALMDFPDGPDRYTITKMHYRVHDADAIEAWVDFHKDRVVSFDVRDGTVDESTVHPVAAAVVKAKPSRLREDEEGGGTSRAGLVAGVFLSSVLVGAFALGRRYGTVSD